MKIETNHNLVEEELKTSRGDCFLCVPSGLWLQLIQVWPLWVKGQGEKKFPFVNIRQNCNLSQNLTDFLIAYTTYVECQELTIPNKLTLEGQRSKVTTSKFAKNRYKRRYIRQNSSKYQLRNLWITLFQVNKLNLEWICVTLGLVRGMHSVSSLVCLSVRLFLTAKLPQF